MIIFKIVEKKKIFVFVEIEFINWYINEKIIMFVCLDIN